MKSCFIVGAGEFFEYSLAVKPGDLVIAADGGYLHLQKIGINPHIIMGDFDSAEKPDFENLAVFNSEKDDTDTMLAVKYGFEKGFSRFEIYGGTGGRADHTIANIQALSYICKNGGQGFLYDNGQVLTVTASGMEFDRTCKGKISVFSLTERATGVCESGLKYSLHSAELKNSDPLGVSNEFVGQPARISVESGLLLIIYDRQ